MQRKFIGNLFLLQLLNWLVKPVWIFWIDRMAQVNLGESMYGRYYAVFSFGLLFNILLDFGLNNYVSSMVGRTNNPSLVKPILRLRLGLAGVYVLLVAAIGLWQGFDVKILALVAINQILAGFVLFFRSVLQGRHKFKTDSVVSITDRVIAIILCAFFLYGSKFSGLNGIMVFLGAQTAGYAIALMVSIILAFQKNTQKEIAKTEKIRIEILLKQTAWFAVLAAAMSVFTRIDAVMIRKLANGADAEVGLYAQSFRLLDAALIFSSLISTMLLPVFSRLIEEKKSTDTMVWLNVRIILFVAIPAALGASFYGSDILHLLYSKGESAEAKLLQSTKIFTPIMCCFIPMAMVHIFGTFLTAAHKVKRLSILAFACMGLNILFNCFWIPNLGALGAAYSCLITQSAFALGCIFWSFKENAFELIFKRFANIFLWILVSICAFYLLKERITGITGLLAACVTYLLVTVLCGVFWKEMKRVFFKN